MYIRKDMSTNVHVYVYTYVMRAHPPPNFSWVDDTWAAVNVMAPPLGDPICSGDLQHKNLILSVPGLRGPDSSNHRCKFLVAGTELNLEHHTRNIWKAI